MSEADITAEVSKLVASRPAPEQGAQPPTQEKSSLLADNAAFPKQARVGLALMRLVRDNPVETGAVVGGTLAMPLTGGASLPAALAAAGLGSAGGAGVGLAAEQLASGKPRDTSDVLTQMGVHGLLGTAGEGAGRLTSGALKLAGNWLRGAKSPAAPTAPAASAAPARFTGTGSAPTQGVRIARSGRPADVHLSVEAPAPAARPAAAAVTGSGAPTRGVRIAQASPNQFTLSVPSQGATAAPRPQPPPGARLVRDAPPASQPPNTNVRRAIEEAVTELAEPPSAAAPAATETVPTLPASWQRLVQQSPTSAPPASAAADAPLGLSADPPFWSTPSPADDTAGSLRRTFGADDAGAMLGIGADDVRAMTGGPSRRPMVAELAQMDRDYARLIGDPRGQIDPNVLLWLGRNAMSGLGGSALFGPVGGAVGVALANPKATGEVLYQGSRLPHGAMQRALLAALAGDQQ